MARLWLVLALALSLWPSGAAAGTAVPGDPGVALHDGGAPAPRVELRTAGLEIPQALEAHRAGCCGGTQRTGSGGGDPFRVPSGSEILLPHVRSLVGPALAGGGDPATPLCERLPYHATAPPSRR